MAYAGGQFFASGHVGNSPVVMACSSDDGYSWAMVLIPITKEIDVAYSNGKFVAVGGDRGAYSTDGITWTAIAGLMPSGEDDINKEYTRLIYDGDKFLAQAEGGSNVAYSTDGVTWTFIPLPRWSSLNHIVYGDGKFIALSIGRLMYWDGTVPE
jgi:hypothetical protein